jgi:hypothetical protein
LVYSYLRQRRLVLRNEGYLTGVCVQGERVLSVRGNAHQRFFFAANALSDLFAMSLSPSHLLASYFVPSDRKIAAKMPALPKQRDDVARDLAVFVGLDDSH